MGRSGDDRSRTGVAGRQLHVGGSFRVAVDGDGNELSFNGSQWSRPVSIDAGNDLTSVACAGASFCIAVDAGGNAVRFDGSGWGVPAAVDPAGGIGFASVSCPSASFCLAAANSPTGQPAYSGVVSFDGTAWSSFHVLGKPTGTSPQGPEGPPMTTVACASSSYCLAVDLRGRAWSFNGTGWTASPDWVPGCSTDPGCFLVPSAPEAVCPTVGSCEVITGDAVVDGEGSSFGEPQQIASTGTDVNAVSCGSATFCVASDSAGEIITTTQPAVAAFTLTVSVDQAATIRRGKVLESAVIGVGRFPNCVWECAQTPPAGVPLDLRPAPAPGDRLLGWDGSECRLAGPRVCSFTPPADTSITAVFASGARNDLSEDFTSDLWPALRSLRAIPERVYIPLPGKLRVTWIDSASRRVIGDAQLHASRPGRGLLNIRLTRAGRLLIAHHSEGLMVTVRRIFNPTYGSSLAMTQSGQISP